MESITFKKVVVILIHALIGWALCGAIIGVGFSLTSEQNTLVIHAIGAPIIFVAISSVYFKYFSYTTPLQTGLIFLLAAIFLDFFVVALFIEKSFEMFASILGTWIPWALIFLSTFFTGRYFWNRSDKKTAIA